MNTYELEELIYRFKKEKKLKSNVNKIIKDKNTTEQSYKNLEKTLIQYTLELMKILELRKESAWLKKVLEDNSLSVNENMETLNLEELLIVIDKAFPSFKSSELMEDYVNFLLNWKSNRQDHKIRWLEDEDTKGNIIIKKIKKENKYYWDSLTTSLNMSYIDIFCVVNNALKNEKNQEITLNK